MSLSRLEPPLRTKICGVTDPADAAVAVQAGADALGFNFFPGSKRFLDFDAARPWIEALAGQVDRVALVVNATAAEVARLRASGCFEWIQFHGDETQDFCENEGGEAWIKACRIKDGETFDAALAFRAKYLLVDGWKDGVYGGSGARLNWDLMRDFVLAATDRHVFLAGGLTPDNVRDAVRIVRPFGVDVASGVELEPGRKDEYLVREFIRAAVAA